MVFISVYGLSISILFPFQVRRQGRKGDGPPRPKTNGGGLRGPGGKNGLTTEDIEAKISAINSRLGGHSSFDIANPVIVSIKTSPRMKAQLLDQEIESQLLVEFAPKLVQVVFNDGPNPVETRSSGGPIVSFAVDEGRLPSREAVFNSTYFLFVRQQKILRLYTNPRRKAKV